MKHIEWSDQLSLGIKDVDDQHKKLLNIINLLVGAVNKGKGKDVVQKTVKDLREYTVFHFHSEEAFVESIGYPRLAEHRNDHHSLVYKVKDFQRDLYHKKHVTPEQLVEFLKKWLIEHIVYTDLEISKWLAEQKAGEQAGPGSSEGNGPQPSQAADGEPHA